MHQKKRCISLAPKGLPTGFLKKGPPLRSIARRVLRRARNAEMAAA
jgi:hypothetical protein